MDNNVKDTFSNNLNSLISEKKLTQTELAKNVGVPISRLNNYIKGANSPSVEFLVKLKRLYNISIDDFLTKEVNFSKNISTSTSVQPQNIERYNGSYILYFYVSSGYKGMGYNPLKDDLRYGVMSVCPLSENIVLDNTKMSVMISLFKKRSDAEEFKEKIDSISSSIKIKDLHLSNEKHYSGNLDLTNFHVFVSAKCNDDRDRLFIIFNSPPTDRSYMGGLGTVNSISTGREPAPVIQYMLISRNVLDIPDGEIYNLLNLPLEDFDITSETVSLIKQFKELYLDKKSNLEDFEKKYIMQNNIEKVVRDVVRRNVFRYAKVSNREDDKYYRISVAYKKDSKK